VQGFSSSYVAVRGYSPTGIGVRGVSLNDFAVQGLGGGLGSGVYGKGTVWAGLFEGNAEVRGTLEVSGSIVKRGGGFRIDHPLSPESKYLQHSFVESPDMKNVYDGVEQLGEDGSAWVDLPEWFGELNRNYRYQLTAIGGPVPDLHVAEEISENRFKIAGGKEGLKVCWQVTGVRKDEWAEVNRVEVELEKSEEQRVMEPIGEAQQPPQPPQLPQPPQQPPQPPAMPPSFDFVRLQEESRRQIDELSRQIEELRRRVEGQEKEGPEATP
jgi:hypothetical protein